MEPEIGFVVAIPGRSVCRYAAPFPAGSPDTLSGTVNCGTGTKVGTWRAVRGGALGSVTVTPSIGSVVAGGRRQFLAELRTRSGDRAFGRAVTWSSSNAAVATIAPNGLATAAGSGTVTITALAGGASGSATLSVPPPLTMTAVSAGIDHTCALEVSGEAWCWGVNWDGQLGDDSTYWRSGVPVRVAGRLTFTGISAGWAKTCGLATGGAAYCWGSSNLGNGSTTGSAVPVPVAGGHTFVEVTSPIGHTCGRTTSGAAYCWGWNYYSQLGDGSTTDRTMPVPVAGGFTFVALRAAGRHTCGLIESGAAYCWGSNHYGQLGDGSDTDRSTPVLVAGGLSFAGIFPGFWHTCGITRTGAAYCWGRNDNGQLGDGSTTQRALPVPVASALTFASISAANFHTCGVTSDGAAYCWGRNDVGELGNNSTTRSATPVAVAGGLTFASLSAAGEEFDDYDMYWLTDRTCGITTGGVAYCWGDDTWGLLGTGSYGQHDGSGARSLVPVKVAGQR